MSSPAFPQPPPSMPPTSKDRIDALVEKLAAKKGAWVGTPIDERVKLLDALQGLLQQEAEGWARCIADQVGVQWESPLAGECWLEGPWATARNIHLLKNALLQGGRPKPAGISRRRDGQVVANVLPTTTADRMALMGWSLDVWLEPGADPVQGFVYRQKHHDGRVALVLGAGNIPSIAPTDALYKLFVEDEVVVLKMNPVNESMGPFLERIFRPLVERGVFGVVYGGADAGRQLTDHPLVDTVHITGSDRTHDAIVWGGDADEQQRRKAANDPRLTKPISSELGCVSPVLVVPGGWSDDDVAYQARHLASMVVHNASFDCVAPKALLLPSGWSQAGLFVEKLEDSFRKFAPRRAYYPGAEDRWKKLLELYPASRVVGKQVEGAVPFTVVPDVPAKKGEHALTNEAFCAVLATTTIDASDPTTYLQKAVAFANESVWGQLSCTVLAHPATMNDHREAFDRAIGDLRYGAVAINAWAGGIFGLSEGTWGAFPGNPLDDIQSGRGTVHNAFLFERPQKSVFKMPWRPAILPPYLADHRTLKAVGEGFTRWQAKPTLLGLPAVAIPAMRG
jgi:acyl-CoA reductase-like NAD-dependent aldehyde dehydrogenase